MKALEYAERDWTRFFCWEQKVHITRHAREYGGVEVSASCCDGSCKIENELGRKERAVLKEYLERNDLEFNKEEFEAADVADDIEEKRRANEPPPNYRAVLG